MLRPMVGREGEHPIFSTSHHGLDPRDLIPGNNDIYHRVWYVAPKTWLPWATLQPSFVPLHSDVYALAFQHQNLSSKPSPAFCSSTRVGPRISCAWRTDLRSHDLLRPRDCATVPSHTCFPEGHGSRRNRPGSCHSAHSRRVHCPQPAPVKHPGRQLIWTVRKKSLP